MTQAPLMQNFEYFYVYSTKISKWKERISANMINVIWPAFMKPVTNIVIY